MREFTEEEKYNIKRHIAVMFIAANLIDNTIIKIAMLLGTDHRKMRREEMQYYEKFNRLIEYSKKFANSTQKKFKWDQITDLDDDTEYMQKIIDSILNKEE